MLVSALTFVLFANTVIAFSIAFFWHAKVLLTLFWDSDWEHAYVPWKALRNQKSPQNTFGHFFAGEIFPELRRKWIKAIAYAAVSFATLFLVVGLLKIFAPEHSP